MTIAIVFENYLVSIIVPEYEIVYFQPKQTCDW